MGLLLLAWCLEPAWGATPGSHQLEASGPLPAGGLLLTTQGGPSGNFQPFFDLFPIESSVDLDHWTLSGVLVATNSSSVAAGAVMPVDGNQRFFRTPTNAFPTAFPKPTGPYPVGMVSRLFSSATRTSTQLGTNRMFMVTIVYPAGAGSASLPEPWLEPVWVATPPRGVIFDKEFLLVIRPSEVATGLVSHAFPEMPVAGGSSGFPVLLYSHGGQYFRKDNLHKMTELASHGFVVVSPDYYDAWFSVLPDGTPAVYDPVNDFPHTNLGQGLHDFSVLDARFVLDELERLNASDPRFQGRLDLSRMGAFGWSFGGATAADLCRTDPRIKAAVLYDAAFWASPDTTKQGLSKPFLCINSEHPPSPDWATPAINLVNRAAANAQFLVLAGTEHADFTDLILVDIPTPAMHGLSRLVTDYTRAFFSHHLNGAVEPSLDAPPGDGSVLGWIRK